MMLARWTILCLLLVNSTLLFAQFDRATFKRMAPEERFTFMNEYLTNHWWEFYDSTSRSAKQATRLSEYRFMRSVAKDPKTISLLRVFWCRNQQFFDFYSGRQQQAVIDSFVAIQSYALQQHLPAEEGIVWLAWCKAILEYKGSMPMEQRQKKVHDGAIRGMALLENLPLSVAHQYHGAIYDITHHLWWMSMYFFRIEDYQLAGRLAALANRFAHPQLDTLEGNPYGYEFYKWESLNLSGSCHLRLGDWKQAQLWYQKAYAFARSHNDQLKQEVSYSNFGVALQQQGNSAAAQPYLERARVLVRQNNAGQSDSGPLSEEHFQFRRYDKANPFNRERFQHLSPEERFAVMDDYFLKHWRGFQNATPQSALLADYHFMKNVAKDPKSLTLLRVFWTRNRQYTHVDEGKRYNEVQDSLVSIRAYAHQNGLPAEEGICWLLWCKLILEQPNNMAHHTRRILVYDGAVKGLNLLENLPLSALHHYHGATYELTYHLWYMSMYFFRIEEYELARRVATLGNRCAHSTLDIKGAQPYDYNFYKWQFLNDLGSCNLRLGDLNQAGIWYRKAYEFARSQHAQVRQGVSYGNLGVVLSKQGKSVAAIPYLEQSMFTARQGNDRQSEFNAIVPLSEVYLQLKQYDKAFPTLQRAIAIYNSVNAIVPEVDSLTLIPLLAGLGEVYQQRGDLKQALYYTQLANRLEVKRRQNNDARIFRQKQEKLEAEAYRAKLDQVEGDWQGAVWLRNALAAGLVLALISFLIYEYNQRRKRYQAKQQLALLAEQARAHTAHLAELQKQGDTAAVTPDAPLPNLNELIQQTLLTDAGWVRFRKLFEQVYPDYLIRLRASYPTLTPAEIRLICLSRLNLSTKEMADMLGVSADTVFKTRYRIRKKINLPEGTDLNEAFGQV